ncbi:polysaccharide pyruvyl transferase family protein [Falsirhodobacter algicola]|nr:polysaccharide pyruvyl transferase family protein [Falsirhodobacter algicola]
MVEADAATPPPPLTLISFYTTGGYYEERAEELRAQCARLGLACDIQPITLDENENWVSICRRKVGFWREMLHKHQAPIMWVDVDAVLMKNPDDLGDGAYDIAIFPRNFKYMPQYNLSTLARTFHPGYILFRYTPATIQFLDDAVALEKSEEGDFTDDFVLEQAFRTSEAQPRILLLSPRDILKPNEADRPDALFRHGDSGNVKDHKGKVRQHVPRALEPDSQKMVVNELIAAASKAGKRDQVIFLLRYLVSIDGTDITSYVKLLDILKRAKDEAGIAAEMKRGRSVPTLAPYAMRFALMRALDAGKWDEADALVAEIEATGDAKVTAFAHSRSFRHSLDRRAEAAGIPDDRRVKLFWWEEPHPGNLGDIVNPYIVEKMTGVPPKFAPRGEGMCAIGSVIKFAKAGTPVWGSGSPHADDTLAPDAVYHSVRGPMTRDLVLRNGGTCPEVYGDAAWFLPILYRPEVPKTHKTGLILHFTHEDAPLDIDPSIRRIDIRRLGYDQIEAFLTEMLSCERIVSSSLHGVIIAQAYGIPACLATVTNARQQIHGDGIKFQDYYASVGVDTPPVPLDLGQLDHIGDDSFTPSMFTPIGKRINLTSLIEAAPFATLPEVTEKAVIFDRA